LVVGRYKDGRQQGIRKQFGLESDALEFASEIAFEEFFDFEVNKRIRRPVPIHNIGWTEELGVLPEYCDRGYLHARSRQSGCKACLSGAAYASADVASGSLIAPGANAKRRATARSLRCVLTRVEQRGELGQRG